MDASPPLSRQLGKTLWYGYSPDTIDAVAKHLFTMRFGYPPQEVLRGASVVLCGPVVEKEPSGTIARETEI